ncbi:MAG: T9SS type A sorting domain-containing protein [Bacteroidetes bacterium]|nr:T9SS type A sorting domain-containing protein [Bacteroidota bacterium]
MTLPITGTYNSLFFTSNSTGYIAGQFEVGSLPLIMKTIDVGITWEKQVLTEVGILNSIFFVNDDVGFACGRVGLMLKTTSGGVTDVADENNLPFDFSLAQNYPNPFNPTTKIQYAISNRQFISLNVYDVLGNEISVLVNEEKPSGTYEVEFDASQLPSGVYMYRLTAGNFSSSKKLILLK